MPSRPTEDEPPIRHARRRLRRRGDRRIVAAVSGGGDSVGLLRALHRLAPELGLSLSVAHLDHGVRGEAAEADVRFVAGLAEALGLPFDLGHWSPTRPGHFEADARRARYEWLAGIARDRGASAVAVGHNRDDQAETILHRILRGTGPRGLAGMPGRRPLAEGVALIRPLLDVSREEIHRYLAAIGQPFRDDATNADLSRTRARIRHDLLPKLAEEYNPKVAEALVRLGRLAGATGAFLDRQLDEAERWAVVGIGPKAVALLCGQLARWPTVIRAEILQRVWRRSGWPEADMDASRWLRLARMVRRDRGRFSVGGGIDAWLSGDILRLAPATENPRATPSTPISFPVPGSAIWGDDRIVATLDPDDPRDESIDLDRLEPFRTADERPFLWIKAPADKVRFEPLGMGGRGMALNDFLRGRGVPRERRGEVPLVCDKAGIIWVVGHRIADRVRRTGSTSRVLGLRRELNRD